MNKLKQTLEAGDGEVTASKLAESLNKIQEDEFDDTMECTSSPKCSEK